MSETLSIAIGQINVVVGAIDDNTTKIIETIQIASALKADLVIFPELCISGYPPEDLLFRPCLHRQITKALALIQEYSHDINIIIGHPQMFNNQCYNAASWLSSGKIMATYQKQCLPNYSVFDEQRYFSHGLTPCTINIKGVRLGLLICEDGWFSEPSEALKKLNANLIIQISASPFYSGKPTERLAVAKKRVSETGIPIICTQLIGGQDELIFDGGSFTLDKTGDLIQQSAFFEESLDIINFNTKTHQWQKANHFTPAKYREDEFLYKALALSVKDYLTKNNFPGVLLGLSGGIDSALSLAIAVDALGASHVEVVLMPSRYTSPLSLEGAMKQAQILNVKITNISIEPLFQSCLESLAPRFKDLGEDVTEENIQARCRGMILMAISNKTGKLVLTTGNKSELAVGYSTLYGDMAGGFDVLKDLYKTKVYDLARFKNSQGEKIIPEIVINRAPSAELKENQTDQDSLPDYALLDDIIKQHMEDSLDSEELIEQGLDKATVKRVLNMIKRNEYKRRQGAIGPKLTKSAFGKDWRYPITGAHKAGV